MTTTQRPEPSVQTANRLLGIRKQARKLQDQAAELSALFLDALPSDGSSRWGLQVRSRKMKDRKKLSAAAQAQEAALLAQIEALYATEDAYKQSLSVMSA